MILFIDTSDFHNLKLVLIDKVITEFVTEVAFNENYKTNEFLEKFLKKAKVKPKDLKRVVVCSGPGSFTGIRVGVSLAQALGFALRIPVIAIPKNKIPADLMKLRTIKLPTKLILHYGQKPNITKAKKKTRPQ
jgi:tRNA threonylcarbamoyladenosine biosynthesis protein TsaB